MDNYLLLILISFAVSVACGFALIPMIANYCIKNNLYDIPNARKVHKDAIPRLGGICFLPSTLLAFVFGIAILNYMTGKPQITVGFWSVMFLISLSMIYVVGIVDDIIGVSPMTKFLVQIVAASLLPLSGLYINDLYGMFGIHEIPYWLGAPLTVFIVVFIDNAINLIDGIDGLAAGLALLSLAGFLICFVREGITTYAILIAGLMGILFSYLYFNVFGDAKKGHKIFMGDSGSLTIGFVLGFLLIKFSMNNPNVMPYRSDSLLTTYTLLIVPCFDVVRVSLCRLRNKRSIFSADKNHIHHKLMRCGLTQHQALITIIGMSLFFVLLNHLLHGCLHSTEIVIIDVAVFTTFQLAIDFILRRKSLLAEA